MNANLLPSPILRVLKRPIWMLVHGLTGKRMQAAARYLDYDLFGGVFPASLAKVQARLPAGFLAVERRPGETEIQILALDYREMDLLAPYHELAVMAPVRWRSPKGELVEGNLVLEMPVTSEEARWAGVDNYGFPKILAQIEVGREGRTSVCAVRHNGQHVLTMRVDDLPTTIDVIPNRMVTVRDDGKVVTCTFDFEGQLATATSPSFVHVELGYDAIADQLRGMGVRLEDGRARIGRHLHSLLSVGTEIGTIAPIETTRRRPAPPIGAPAHGSPMTH